MSNAERTPVMNELQGGWLFWSAMVLAAVALIGLVGWAVVWILALAD